MKELPLIGDRITVLRDGKLIKTLDVGDVTDEQLVNLMVGREISQVYVREGNAHEGVTLKADNLSDKAGRVRNCSIELHRGEIVGLAGMVGSGRTELARLIFGIDKAVTGAVYVHGKRIQHITPSNMVKNGLGLLPEDRKGAGLALKVPIAWNVLAVSLKKYFPNFFISPRKIDENAKRYVKELRIATPDVVRPVRNLSGGNQQKVVISKWLSADSDIIIFDEPTRGIDVGAKMEIYALMNKLVNEGKTILMISSEMAEILGMSDRLYIMRDGEIVCEFKRGEASQDEIGAQMLGVGGKANGKG